MDALPDVPVVVLIATALAAVLILVEAALPTMGVAGTAALGFAVVAVLSADDDQTWWPLLFVVVAVMMWAVQLTVRRHHRTLEIVAGVAFAGGSIGYGVATRDVPAIVVAAVTSVAMPAIFPRLAQATRRMLDQPAQAGMESLVGLTGVVVNAVDEPGAVNRFVVRVEGSLWNAQCAAALSPGARVVVTGFDAMTLDIALVDAGTPRSGQAR